MGAYHWEHLDKMKYTDMCPCIKFSALVFLDVQMRVRTGCDYFPLKWTLLSDIILMVCDSSWRQFKTANINHQKCETYTDYDDNQCSPTNQQEQYGVIDQTISLVDYWKQMYLYRSWWPIYNTTGFMYQWHHTTEAGVKLQIT